MGNDWRIYCLVKKAKHLSGVRASEHSDMSPEAGCAPDQCVLNQTATPRAVGTGSALLIDRGLYFGRGPMSTGNGRDWPRETVGNGVERQAIGAKMGLGVIVFGQIRGSARAHPQTALRLVWRRALPSVRSRGYPLRWPQNLFLGAISPTTRRRPLRHFGQGRSGVSSSRARPAASDSFASIDVLICAKR